MSRGIVAKRPGIIIQATATPRFFNPDPTNTGDGLLTRQSFAPSYGGIGSAGFPTTVTTNPETWYRIALTVSYDPSDSSKVFVRKFINGTNLGNTPPENDPTLDGRWSLDPANGFLLLADNDGETGSWFVSSFYFTDRAMSVAEIARSAA